MPRFTTALAVLALAGPAAAQDLNGEFAVIDQLWMQRDQDDAVRKMRQMCQELYDKNPDNADVLWRQARALWHKAELTPNDDKGKKALTEECIRISEKCEKLAPRNANCPYHVGLCLGEYSHAISIVSALWEGIEGKFRGAHERAIKLDEKVGDAGPWNSIGRMYYEMPWPKRDLPESVKWLKEAMRVNPANVRGMVFLAESYLAMDQPKEAKKWVDKLLDEPPPGKDPFEEKKARKDAEPLRKKIEEALK
jgi:tetratricopeptide (TPR) repeat protein